MDNKFLEYCINTKVLSQSALSDLQGISGAGSDYEQIVKMGLISQEQLAVSAGEFYKCQVVDLSKVRPEPKATAYGNATDCRRFQFIPFAIEPAGGLLVALADYALLQGAQIVLKSARVERMKFYIAPVVTLLNMVDTVYGVEKQEAEPHARPKRSMSILRTQYLDLDLSNLRKDNPGGNDANSQQQSSVDLRKLQAITQELAACRDENMRLKNRVDQLIATVELETSMIRDLAKLLNHTGVMDSKTYENWFINQR